MSTIEAIKLEIKGQEQNTYAIHYSCNGFYCGGAVAPTLCCIAMTNLKTQEKNDCMQFSFTCNPLKTGRFQWIPLFPW